MARWPFDFRSLSPARHAAADFYLAPQSRPRPVDRGLGRPGGPETLVPSPLIGQRRAVRRRPEADPAEGALARVRQRDVAHRGPVLALVVADLDLAPAAVPHTASLRFVPCAPRLPAERGRDPATAARRHQPPTARCPAATVAVPAATVTVRPGQRRGVGAVSKRVLLAEPKNPLLSRVV